MHFPIQYNVFITQHNKRTHFSSASEGAREDTDGSRDGGRNEGAVGIGSIGASTGRGAAAICLLMLRRIRERYLLTPSNVFRSMRLRVTAQGTPLR